MEGAQQDVLPQAHGTSDVNQQLRNGLQDNKDWNKVVDDIVEITKRSNPPLNPPPVDSALTQAGPRERKGHKRLCPAVSGPQPSFGTRKAPATSPEGDPGAIVQGRRDPEPFPSWSNQEGVWETPQGHFGQDRTDHTYESVHSVDQDALGLRHVCTENLSALIPNMPNFHALKDLHEDATTTK